MSLPNEIAGIFEVQGHQWSVDGKLMDVTPEMVEEVLDNLYEVLYDGSNLSQAGTGGILMVKDGTHYDVYLNIGEYDGTIT